MPSNSKKSTPAPGPQRLTTNGSHSASSNSGRSMPPTTRAMQGRLPSTSSPQVQAGPSRSTTQQASSQRASHAPVTGGVGGDDDDDDDDDEEEDDDDDSDDSDEDSDSDDDDDDVPTKILKIFAIAEPNGLTEPEMRSEQAQNDQANSSSRIYYELLKAVAEEALTNPTFYSNIVAKLRVPSNNWSIHMYTQLRTRLDVTTMRFDRSSSSTSHHYDVVNTSRRFRSLVDAVRTMIEPDTVNWPVASHVTRLQYFGLLLDILIFAVANDKDHRGSRAGSGSGSGGSSPYAVVPPTNHNLYQQMVGTWTCAHAMRLLHELFNSLGGDLGTNQANQVKKLLEDVKHKHQQHPLEKSQDFVTRLRALRDAIRAAAARRS